MEELLISLYPNLSVELINRFIDTFKKSYKITGYYYPDSIRKTLNKSYSILNKLRVIILGDTEEFYYNLNEDYWKEFFIPPFDVMGFSCTFAKDLDNIINQGVGIYNLYPTHYFDDVVRDLWNDFVLNVLDREYICTPILCTNISLPESFINKFYHIPFSKDCISSIQKKLIELNYSPLRIYDKCEQENT